MNYRIKPFDCTNCGRSLLIDQMQVDETDPKAWDAKEFRVSIIIDNESFINPEWWQKPEWRGMGRKELIQKIYALRHEIRELEYKTCPWWKKPFHKDRRFI